MCVRKLFLLDLAEHLKSNILEYGRIISQEIGKPINESIMEVDKCSLVCRYYAQNGQGFLENDYIETFFDDKSRFSKTSNLKRLQKI